MYSAIRFFPILIWLILSKSKHPNDKFVNLAIQAISWCHESRKTILMMTSSNGNISALLALCAGNSPVTGEFPVQRPVTRSFGVLFDLRLNKSLSKQSWAGDLRRHHAYHGVTVLSCIAICNTVGARYSCDASPVANSTSTSVPCPFPPITSIIQDAPNPKT